MYLLVGFAVLPPLALADSYADGPPSSGWKPDNSEHTYCWGGDYTGNYPRDAAHESMQRLQNQTTMVRNYVQDCGSATDLRFAIGDLGGADGEYRCTNLFNRTCQHAIGTFDRQNITSFDDWRQTTCHEIGHSVGLTHADDCMGNNSNEQSYSPHHVDHINHDR